MGVSAGEAQPTKGYTKDTDDDHDRYQVYMLEDKHVMKGHGMIGFYPILKVETEKRFPNRINNPIRKHKGFYNKGIN